MKEKINEFIELSKIYEITINNVSHMLNDQQELKEKLLPILDRKDFVDYISSFYEKYFNNDDFDNILNFFRSDTGKKMIKINMENEAELNTLISEWLNNKINK